MKIAIIVPIVGNFGRKGHYHSQEIGLGKMLVEMGHEVTVIKCVSKNTMQEQETDTHDSLKIVYYPVKHLGPHGFLPVNVIDKNADVLFTFSDTQLCIPKLYRYCRKNEKVFIPYIGISHSFQKNLKSKIMDVLFRILVLPIYRKVPVMTKTIYAAKELNSMGVRNCEIAPVGLNFSFLHENYDKENREEIRRAYGYSAEDVIISFVGRFQREKRPIDMIKIFQSVNRTNKKLLMVGDGVFREEVEKYIRSENLVEQVQIIPQVKYEEMWKIHYISDFFVNLRAEEIFGMAVMEAVYYKSCVVARSAPGPDTILADMRNHFICKDDDEVVRILSSAVVDGATLECDRDILMQQFTWKTCGEKILTIVGDRLCE